MPAQDWRKIFEADPKDATPLMAPSGPQPTTGGPVKKPGNVPATLTPVPLKDFMKEWAGDGDADLETPWYKVDMAQPPLMIVRAVLQPVADSLANPGGVNPNPKGVRLEDFNISFMSIWSRLMHGQTTPENPPYRYIQGAGFWVLYLVFQHRGTRKLSIHDAYWVAQMPDTVVGEIQRLAP